MNVSAHQLAGAAKKKRPPAPFVWHVSGRAAEARAQLESRVAQQPGCWIDGDDFQVATSSDPSAPVLSGTIRWMPGGVEVTAAVTSRQEVKDILRFARLLLLGFLMLVVTGLGLQSEGSELAAALAGLAIGCAVAGGVASVFEARIAERVSQADVGELNRLMHRLLF